MSNCKQWLHPGVDVQGKCLPVFALDAQFEQDIKGVEVIMKTDLRPGVLNFFLNKVHRTKKGNQLF